MVLAPDPASPAIRKRAVTEPMRPEVPITRRRSSHARALWLAFGVICMILKLFKLPDGNQSIIVHGLARFRLTELLQHEPFASGRIAQGYMLTGVRGVGKTTTARILARGLNYEVEGAASNGPTVDMPALGRHC